MDPKLGYKSPKPGHKAGSASFCPLQVMKVGLVRGPILCGFWICRAEIFARPWPGLQMSHSRSNFYNVGHNVGILAHLEP